MSSPYPFEWSNPAFDASPFHKWEKEGDTIEGVITDITTTTFPAKDDEPEKTYPVLHLDTAAGPKELTVSSVDLLAKTKVHKPQVGDWYAAGWVATAGKKRIFTVQVKKPPVDASGQAEMMRARAAAEQLGTPPF